MKKLIIGQSIIATIILTCFYLTLSSKGNLEVSLFITSCIAAGIAGAAFLGIFAPYVLGATAALLVCSLIIDSGALIAFNAGITVGAYYFATQGPGKLDMNKKTLFLSSATQLMVILIPIINTLLHCKNL